MKRFAVRTSLLFIAICTAIGATLAQPNSFGDHPQGQSPHIDVGWLPAFARNSSAEAQQQLIDIFKNQSYTKQQVFDAMKTWAQQQGSSMVTAVEQFEQDVKLASTQLESAINKSSNLGTQERDALLKIAAINVNMTITGQQEETAVQEIFRGLSDIARRNVQQFLDANSPKPSAT